MTTLKPAQISIYCGVFDEAMRKTRWRRIGHGFVNVDGKSLAWHIEHEVRLEPGSMLIIRATAKGR